MSGEKQPILPFGDEPPAAKVEAIEANAAMPSFDIEARRERFMDKRERKREGESDQIAEYLITKQVKCVFEDKPDAETRKHLKQNGFRWERSVWAWQRRLNAASRFSAKRMHAVLEGK